MATTKRILVRLQPSAALAAAASRKNVRPLYDTGAPSGTLGLAGAPTWHIADLPDGSPTLWDVAHARVADQLGVSDADALYAEPDLPQSYPTANERGRPDQPFAVTANCADEPQKGDAGRVTGPGFAWHLKDAFSELGSARASVAFADVRTRIAHIDTGYDKNHVSRPEHILDQLERNFVDGDSQPNSSQDPNRRHLFDNSGDGTGTIGILAGREIGQNGNDYLCRHHRICSDRPLTNAISRQGHARDVRGSLNTEDREVEPGDQRDVIAARVIGRSPTGGGRSNVRPSKGVVTTTSTLFAE